MSLSIIISSHPCWYKWQYLTFTWHSSQAYPSPKWLIAIQVRLPKVLSFCLSSVLKNSLSHFVFMSAIVSLSSNPLIRCVLDLVLSSMFLISGHIFHLFISLCCLLSNFFKYGYSNLLILSLAMYNFLLSPFTDF